MSDRVQEPVAEKEQVFRQMLAALAKCGVRQQKEALWRKEVAVGVEDEQE